MKLTEEYNYGWYGQCGPDPCEPLDLNSYTDTIASVFQINEDGSSYVNWDPTRPAFLNRFTTLDCGRAYNIRLTQQALDSGGVDIPNFIRTDEGTTRDKIISRRVCCSK